MVGTEFAHLHPPDDGSLHLVLPAKAAQEMVQKGWGELDPAARMGIIPATAVMVHGPRDERKLEVVWLIVLAAYASARGLALEELKIL